MAKVDWNTEEYSSGRSFEPLPKGRYPVRIDRIDKKDTKNRDGYYYEVEMSVDSEGPNKGRKLWERLNVSNPSETAQRIGRERFNALCEACGFEKGTVRDTRQLENKRVIAVVGIEDSPQGPMNRVPAFVRRDEGVGRDVAAGAGSSGSDDDIPF